MNDRELFKRFAAISAIVAAPVALTSWVLLILSVEGNLGLVEDMANVITLGAPAAGYIHVAWMITDTFGYLLLLAPAAVYLLGWLKSRSPNLVQLATFFGFAYFVVGAIAVYLLAGMAPAMMRAHESASGAQQETLLLVFQNAFNMAYYGVGPLGWFFGGLWWLGTGVVLWKERRIFGAATVILGLLALVVWFEQAFHLQALVIVETPFLFFIPIWSVWIGVVIWRREEKSERLVEAAVAARVIEGGTRQWQLKQ